MRLFAFHHAGGSAAAFAGWQRALGPGVEVVAVELPGRGRDGWGARHADTESLTAALRGRLGPRLTGPYVFYGHSMGAMVAYRLARSLVESGWTPPERLLVGAFAAPHLAHVLNEVGSLSDGALAEMLIGISRLPSTASILLEDPNRLERTLTLVREDLRVCGDRPRRAPGRPLLPCPIDVFAGADDPLVPMEDAAAWRSYTTADCTFRAIPGGHFFPRESRDVFFRELGSALSQVTRAVTR
ncbi:thioesterase II family protein [Microbispora siamensis]